MSKIFRSFPAPATALWALAAALTFALGCSPQIGDACDNDNDCPEQPRVVCDQSVEDGLCTVTDCRPDECPSESVCVQWDRHEAYCMKHCETDADCRTGHVCRDDEDIDVRYCFVPAE